MVDRPDVPLFRDWLPDPETSTLSLFSVLDPLDLTHKAREVNFGGLLDKIDLDDREE